MCDFFQQYGSYISAVIVIVFQIVKWIINNVKMKNKFDKVLFDGLDVDKIADEIVKKLDKSVKKIINEEENKNDQEKK